MRKILFSAALTAIMLFLYIPAEAKGGAYEKGFGFTAGTVSGIGFAKRTYKTEMEGSQLGFVAWLADNSGFIDMGYQKINFINRQKSVGLYWLYGAALWLKTDNSPYYGGPNTDGKKIFTYSATLMPGAGLGIELGLEKHLKLNIELPLSIFIEYSRSYDYMLDRFPEGLDISIYPIPQVSLIYFY